jgi:hypothetical protein
MQFWECAHKQPKGLELLYFIFGLERVLECGDSCFANFGGSLVLLVWQVTAEHRLSTFPWKVTKDDMTRSFDEFLFLQLFYPK